MKTLLRLNQFLPFVLGVKIVRDYLSYLAPDPAPRLGWSWIFPGCFSNRCEAAVAAADAAVDAAAARAPRGSQPAESRAVGQGVGGCRR